MQNYIGELAALTTAFCWAVTASAFEVAGKKIGSQPLNLTHTPLNENKK